MKVKELIEALSALDPDKYIGIPEVVIPGEGGNIESQGVVELETVKRIPGRISYLLTA